ncbi:hypothetical protein NQ314_000982 [Rhamnusium bicolor]|uniref:Nuclease HARBI1 n=1 Tax=Rhamnusium bicolor TaxID=1586634 RepID=A0AAV8ZUN7_9CUCU|nr:hypothetical protein NQ314_000982 [Rhamnusium bicolor]
MEPPEISVRENHFLKWNENEFRQRFRLSKETVELIIEEIKDEILCLRNENTALTPVEMVLVTLSFLAIGSILQIIGDFNGIDKSTASRVISKVIRIIAQLGNQFINMPSTAEELQKVKQGFYAISHKDTKPNQKIFGVFKRRFPVLALGIRLDVNKVEAIVVACAVLHNIACQVGEPELEVDQDVEDAIQVANGLNLDDPPDIHIDFNMNNVARYNLITQYFQGLL